MKPRNFMIAIAMVAAIAIGGIGYAMGPGGGSGGGGMGGSGSGGAGGSGPGMMGGGGYDGIMDGSGHGGMMGSGQGFFSLRGRQSQRPPEYQFQKRHTEKLRDEIREKRHELSEVLRSEKPDKEMVEHKMAELNRLEAELDYEMSPN